MQEVESLAYIDFNAGTVSIVTQADRVAPFTVADPRRGVSGL
jgi:hypothetical protein